MLDRPPVASVISVGDELVLGTSVDTNSGFAARALTALGVRVRSLQVVRDDVEELSRLLKRESRESEIVLVGGGLGPTADDRTREAVAEALGRPLEFREELLEAISARYSASGREMPESNRQQAFVPEGAEAIENPHGTAPGILVDRGSRLLICLPGVPLEFCSLVEHVVLEAVRAKYLDSLRPHGTRSLLVTGVPESALDLRLRPRMEVGGNPSIGVTARVGAIRIHVVASGEDGGAVVEVLDTEEGELRELLGADVCQGYPESAEAAVAACESVKRVAVADAVTGGLLASRLATQDLEVTAWAGTPAFIEPRLAGLDGCEEHLGVGAVEAAAAAAATVGVEAGVAIWPGQEDFLFVAAILGERAAEAVVVPTDDPAANRRRVVGKALDLLRRLGEGLEISETSEELEALAELAEDPEGGGSAV